MNMAKLFNERLIPGGKIMISVPDLHTLYIFR